MTRPILPLAVLLTSIAACSTVPPPGAVEQVTGTCNAEAARWTIGRAASPETVEDARLASQSRDVRVIEPGQAVTMDYRHDRLNIDVNERGAITGVRCG
ncbi:I78 family peptidase inhibitor [Novilysobacter defluvii]|uniref:Peptidase inhibitor I78 family protein n=1 Tax=Lysobacter defluvii IMMIB APB-9 = DSM 18482 TaxID=1385515 RepID=A0A0A0M714_9GAMM|nr:I78 family peptidase inhibitor [Lysobacter defluvii]KGO97832.1 hypothetical protein N791_02535 [Lysobacter defluvii IMMIB APB-9 = DSM 18482]